MSLSIERTANHLKSWLKVNQIMQRLNDEIVTDSIDSVLTLFGTNTNLLTFLTTYSSNDQLNAIYQILHENLQKFKAKQKSKQHNLAKPKNNISDESKQSNINCFNSISSESITNICRFLSRAEISEFKLTERRIAIISLEEMTTISVGICDTTQLLNSKHKKTLNFKNHLSYQRYNNNTTYSMIFDQLETKNKNLQLLPILITRYKSYWEKYPKINKKK
eukprot:311335_1